MPAIVTVPIDVPGVILIDTTVAVVDSTTIAVSVAPVPVSRGVSGVDLFTAPPTLTYLIDAVTVTVPQPPVIAPVVITGLTHLSMNSPIRRWDGTTWVYYTVPRM